MDQVPEQPGTFPGPVERVMFQGIPTEIRCQIFLDVLVSHSDAPPGPWDSQDRAAMNGRRHERLNTLWPKKQNPTDRVTNLLLVSRQFHADVSRLLATNKATRSYALDVMFVKTAGLWPTWTSIPASIASIRQVDTLYTTFRIFDPPELDANRKMCFYGGGCGGPQLGVWGFYFLLTGFLEYGPGDRGGDWGAMNCNFTIRKLVLDVKPPPPEEDHPIVGVGRRQVEAFSPSYNIDAPITGVSVTVPDEPSSIPAEKLAAFMADELYHLLCLGYYRADYGSILYEGIVESIEVRVGGEARVLFDMDEMLAGCTPRDWGATASLIVERKKRWAAWESWVKERRRLLHAGKTVPWLENPRPHDRIF